jgi:PAS domain S-box-containing protein
MGAASPTPVYRMQQRSSAVRATDEQGEAGQREFTSAFENAAIGMAIVAPDSRRLRVNKAFCQLLGYTEAEMLARTVRDITHADDLSRDIDERKLLLAGLKDTYQREKRYLHRDGRVVWGHLTCTLVRDDAGRPLHFISQVVDVTERKAAQQQLHEMQSLLHMAAQIGRLGAWAWECGAPTVTWSVEVCAIHDVKPGFAPTMDQALYFFAPADRVVMREKLRRCAQDGSPFDTEAQIITAKGRRLWVRVICEAEWHATGEVRRIQGACQDITEAKRAAEHARQVAEQHTITLESLTDAFFTVDRMLKFTYANAQAERLLQRGRDTLLGREVFEAFPDLRGTEVEHQLEHALRENVTVQYEYQYEPLHAWLHVKIHPSQQGLAIHVRDVTQQVAAEREVRRLNAELEERVRERTAQLEAANRELEAFSYSIAHDLRAPLSSIDGFSKFLQQSVGDADPRGVHYLSRIRAGVRQMGELTDGLLALASLSRADMRDDEVDLAQLARAAAASCREGAPQREVEIVLGAAMPVRGDARLLAQVMGNLVGNAWKFTAHAEHARIEIGCERNPDGAVVYFVRDNGAGFDMAYAGRMFEAFQRMHSASEFEGTGIGLAIVHKIVTRHGGRIWAEGAPQRGATFRFTLA